MKVNKLQIAKQLDFYLKSRIINAKEFRVMNENLRGKNVEQIAQFLEVHKRTISQYWSDGKKAIEEQTNGFYNDSVIAVLFAKGLKYDK